MSFSYPVGEDADRSLYIVETHVGVLANMPHNLNDIECPISNVQLNQTSSNLYSYLNTFCVCGTPSIFILMK
jgi:hypothetical protein